MRNKVTIDNEMYIDTDRIDEVKEIEEIIDYLIEELKVKEVIIEELEEKNIMKNQNNEESEENASNESLMLPLEIINIYVAYPLLITYIKNGYMNEFNKVLDIITIDDYKKLNKDNIETIVKCIFKYINKIDKFNKINMKGVSTALKGIVKQDIDKLLPSIFQNILSKKFCVFNIDKKVLLDYAIKYFINDYMDEAKFILSYIINEKFYEEYDNTEIINLIIMSVYFKKYNKILRTSKITSILNNPNNKDSIFINKFINDDKYIDKFRNFEEMKSFVKMCNIDLAKKIYEKLSTINKEIQDIYISRSKNICDFDKSSLEVRKQYIPIYDMKNNKKIRALETNVLWCQKCNKYSLNSILLQEIYKLLNINEGLKFVNLGGLNQMSPLMILGYNTTVDRNKRWDLLEKRIIPTLGVRKVVNHIRFLINLNKNKVNKDFSRSLMEWKYDLDEIKQKYNIY